MGMTIFIEATREIFFKDKNLKLKKDIQKEIFMDMWQVPGDICYEIINGETPFKTYCKWITDNSVIRELPIYAEDDFFNERPPIGIEKYDPAKEHIEEVTNWIEDRERVGFKIKFILM